LVYCVYQYKNNDIPQALTAILTVLGALAVAQIIAGKEEVTDKVLRGLFI